MGDLTLSGEWVVAGVKERSGDWEEGKGRELCKIKNKIVLKIIKEIAYCYYIL